MYFIFTAEKDSWFGEASKYYAVYYYENITVDAEGNVDIGDNSPRFSTYSREYTDLNEILNSDEYKTYKLQ